MKRFCALFLLLCLALQATSCIQLDPVPSESSPDPATQPTDTPPATPPATTPSVNLFPSWNGADNTAELFLNETEHAIVDTSKSKYSYAEMVSDLSALAAAYPSRFSYRSFGTSVAGRELYVAVLGNPNASHQILVSAGIHGREYLTPLLVMKQIEFYLCYYDSGSVNSMRYSTLFENCCFYIVPMTNPDGIMLSQEGIDSLPSEDLKETVRRIYADDYSKEYTYKTDIDEYLKSWKANANGVDLNRNFDALWSDYRMGEPVPCHKNYKGPSAASEPETRAMVELTSSLPNIKAVLCIHSRGEILYWDCGQEDALHQSTKEFTSMIADCTGYKMINEQNNDASYSDWCALEKGLIAVTVETGSGNVPLPISEFPEIWTDNFELLARSALYFEH